MRQAAIIIALCWGMGGCQRDCGCTHQAQTHAADAGAKTQIRPAVVDGVPQIPPPDDLRVPPQDAERSASGLVSKRLRAGHGARPRPFDLVRIHYTAWTADGKTFDSTRERGAPAEVPLEHAIPGWVEGIPLMATGELRRFWVPGTLAYAGQKGWPQGPLVFDIELLGVEPRTEPPAAPAELSGAPPSEAKKTPSGLATLVLAPGKGKVRPGPHDIVTVQYSSWTADGALFDSTVKRGAPATFQLGKVIAGLSEALQLMVVGEKRRLWIPPGLAYLGREGPQGVLVYDIELLDVRKGEAPPEQKARAKQEEQAHPRALP
jgi:peptidylprolyl isomerase